MLLSPLAPVLLWSSFLPIYVHASLVSTSTLLTPPSSPSVLAYAFSPSPGNSLIPPMLKMRRRASSHCDLLQYYFYYLK